MRNYALLVLLLAGCTPKATTQNDTNLGAGATVTVTVGGGNSIMFSPANVTIQQGDTIHWVWGSSGHSITSGSDCTVDGLFCSQSNTNCSADALQNSGDTYDHTFSTVGTFPYHCAAHCSFGMVGSITVVAAGTVIDAGPVDAGTPDAGAPDAGSACVNLTVDNYLSWCAVAVNGGTASANGSITACVPPGTTTLTAVPASAAFQLGDWYGVTAADGGNPGTVTGSGATAKSTVQVAVPSADTSYCVSVCCPFTGGSGCPGTNQCP